MSVTQQGQTKLLELTD